MSKTLPYPLPTLGVDVLSHETAVPKGAVRNATNVDIDRTGGFSRRDGYARVAASPGMHSVFYAAQKRWILVAKGSVLYRLDGTTYEITPLFDLNSADKVAYTEYNGNIYFANRTTIGWIPNDSADARAVGVPTPDAPTLSEALGGLTPGKYGVVVSLVDERGEESGASMFGTVQLPTGGGIRMSGLPQITGFQVNVFITAPDGDILRRAATFPAVFPSYVVAETPQGAQPDTQYLVPMPAGRIVQHHNGRLFTALGNVLHFSEPLRPHLHNPAYGVIVFSGDITFVESVSDGVFVADSRGVWFLSATDPTKFEQRRVSQHRAVALSSVLVPANYFEEDTIKTNAPAAVWLSTAGYIAGVSGGMCVELNADRVKLASGLSGSTTFLLREGRKQLVTAVNSTSTAVYGTAPYVTTPHVTTPTRHPPVTPT